MAMNDTIKLNRYFDFQRPDRIRIKGHRLGIEHILNHYLEGYNPEEIAAEFPGLSLEIIYAAIAYYLANQIELNDYLLRLRTRDEKAYQEWTKTPSPLIQRLRAVCEKQ